MKVAFLHLDPRPGKVTANRRSIEKAINLAAVKGANWVLTPELSVSGYYFADVIGTDWIQQQPDRWMEQITTISWVLGTCVFLSCPERKNNKLYNSIFAIEKGQVVGVHRKLSVHPGVEEAWSTPGEVSCPIKVSGIKTGILVCADTYESDHALTLKNMGAQLVIASAAWGHKYSPIERWLKLTSETGLPLWVCNRTGNERNVDWTQAASVVMKAGQILLSYHGDPAILTFEWDMSAMQPLSNEFEVIYLNQ